MTVQGSPAPGTWSGQVALMTGATTGLGHATTLTQAGTDPVLLARLAARAEVEQPRWVAVMDLLQEVR